MLFVVKLTHDYTTCQAHHPEKFPLFRDTLAKVSDHGIKVHGSYSNRLISKHVSRKFTQMTTKLDAAFDPILEMGNFEVTPVVKR